MQANILFGKFNFCAISAIDMSNQKPVDVETVAINPTVTATCPECGNRLVARSETDVGARGRGDQVRRNGAEDGKVSS
jgi:predicted RNA-binding Zn-ribbon protein involved in translation (DUF1610 family)